MMAMRVLDLFSGIGGFSLGLERAGMQTVAFCEIDPWCRRVLAKHWPDVPIFEDVKKLRGADVGSVDVICGGYPCQPFSVAGQRRGESDDRHLWTEFNRLVDELRPSWVIGENVAGHISMGLGEVLSDLENAGYACRAFVIPAVAVDAPHRRDRVWIIAHANSCLRARRADQPRREKEGRDAAWWLCSGHGQGPVSNTNSAGRKEQHIAAQPKGAGHGAGHFYPRWREWPVEPGMGRVAHGVPNRVDRIRGLGNAVVPQIPEIIGRAILAVETEVREAA